jgi:hypothetical protein
MAKDLQLFMNMPGALASFTLLTFTPKEYMYMNFAAVRSPIAA